MLICGRGNGAHAAAIIFVLGLLLCILFQAIMVCVLICGGGNGAHATAIIFVLGLLLCILFQVIMVCVLICGGGNGAHAAAGTVATQPGMEARVLTLYADEAERWTAAMHVCHITCL